MTSPGWSLRARVALAFLLTTALAMLALGFFVQWRVEHTLEEGLRDQLESEMNRLVAVPADRRAASVEQLAGEINGQLLSSDGEVLASSAAITDRLVDPAAVDDGFSGATIKVLDDLDEGGDDGADAPETEDETSIVLVRTEGDQVLVVTIGREDADDAVSAVRTQLLVSGPVALVIAGALGYGVAGLGLRPIDRMRARAATISSRSAGERLPVPAAAELRRLAVTLNAMLERLDEGMDRERRFVADASHELRTPLQLLLTEVELALGADRSPDELRDALRSVDEEVRRLVALSEDLLALAGADAGHLRLQTEQLDLAALAADVVRRFRATAAAAGRSLVAAADGPATVDGDAERLRRVVSNLVDNALRHGAGDVEVAVSRTAAGVELIVADEGPGFAEERPLERFAGSHGSVGLGLAIADEIVRAHGGHVGIGRADGRTVVRVSLPG